MSHGILGLFAFPLLAWLLSEGRARVGWRLPAAGLALQLGLAALLLYFPGSRALFGLLTGAVAALSKATEAGAGFVFGYLGGAELPFAPAGPGSSFILAFRALPLVLVMSALSALLFYWGVLPRVVRALGWVLRRALGVSGALGMGAAANIFLGMVEAPLLIRPYLKEMPRADLFAVMVTGMATIAGTMMVLYGNVLGAVVPDAFGHILTASLISAPAAILMARILVPPREAGGAEGPLPRSPAAGAMDAITRGTLDGLRLLAGIVAMLVVLVALVDLVNQALGLLAPVGGEALSLQRLFGWLFAPLAWLMGIPWAEATAAGALLGTKTVLNEFLAYLALAELPADALAPHSRLILTYALCGFANFGSLGIMIGGMGAMAPERRDDIVALGGRSLVAGTLATCMTGSVVAVLAG